MSKVLRAIVAAGLLAGALVTATGLIAYWRTALDVVNNGLPFLAAGLLALVALAWATGRRPLIGGAVILFAINLALLLTALPGAAPRAPEGAERFLRVATFNLWGRNDHPDNLEAFLAETDADAVVLEEVRERHKNLLAALAKHYPYQAGDYGLVILSKHPILADGRIDRAGQPQRMSLIIRWATLDVDGTQVGLAGIHLARPFYPAFEAADIARLTQFVKDRPGPLILAGDFNMTPWTWKMRGLTRATGLKRYNTFLPTWPMRWRSLPLLPLLPIDNVFASPHFSAIATDVGPRLDSDHRPVIADIALSE